jgi:hypothetical protein
MDDYISKPVNEGLLVRTIERWVAPVNSSASEPTDQAKVEMPNPDFGSSAANGRSPIRISAIPGLEDLIPEYLANCHKSISALSDAVARGNLNAARGIGHGMKGCGQGYGFADITRIGRGIEQAAEKGDIPGLKSQIAALEDYLSRLEVIYP